MSRPHLLYLAFFYPPSRSSGVHRALATTRAFIEAGWAVTVLTTTERFFEEEIGSIDPTLLELIPEDANVIRVPFSFRVGQPTTDLREFGWVRGNMPLFWNGLRTRAGKLVRAYSVLKGESPLSYPMDDRYLAWIEPVVQRARHLFGDQPFDHILATGNPYASFEAARLLSGMTNARFTIDYRDPWAFDMRTGSEASLSAATFAAEERIVEQAWACIQVNEAIADAYRNRFPGAAERQFVVPNGYDAESIPELRGDYSGGPLVFGMLGTVTDLWPLGPLFEAWHLVRGSLPAGSSIILGGHLGYFHWSAEPLLSSFPEQAAGFVYVGPVPKKAVAEFYSRLDVVIVPLFGGPMVTAGKVYETAALGIPVLCIQREDGGARRIFSNLPLSVGAAPETKEILAAIRGATALAQNVSQAERRAARSSVESFERTVAMGNLVDVVEGAIVRSQA